MKRFKNWLVLYVISFCCMIGSPKLHAGRKKEVLTITPTKETPLFSDKHNILRSLGSIMEKVGNGGEIYLTTFMLTDEDFVESLIKAHTNGASVNICVDRSSLYFSKDLFKKLLDAGIEVYLYNEDFSIVEKNVPVKNHVKLLAWQYPTTDDSGTVMHYRVACGSANHTNLSHRNKEHTSIIPNNKEIYDEFKTLFDTAKKDALPYSVFAKDGVSKQWGKTSQSKTQAVIPQTPQKTKVFSSLTHNLLDIIAERIAKTKGDSSIHVNSYTFNNPKITQELIDAKKRGVTVEFITDKVSLEKDVNALEKNPKTISQLQQLRAAQIPVKVFNRSGKNHSKTIEIERKEDTGSQKIVIESTGNLTDSTNRDINALTIYPNNSPIFKEFKHYHERVAAVADDYSPLKQKFIEQRKEKRKLQEAATENEQPTKRTCQRTLNL